MSILKSRKLERASSFGIVLSTHEVNVTYFEDVFVGLAFQSVFFNSISNCGFQFSTRGIKRPPINFLVASIRE
jgi:hypothetical protein